METRLERNKRLSKSKRINRMKKLCILLLFAILLLSIEIVNQNIVDLNCFENPNIIRFDIKKMELDFFGKSYVIDLSIIKKFIKDQLSGLLVLHNCNYLL
ncbi:hypothetical protein [Tissierella sp.]|uniref:hypothetical protein n=1 Tax=Tissierella sp. TaxID=41274 RepID=UPI0028575A9E|nr:hypothetical protein [Tissierella sp.]MDR7857102.1 hypothetical protein [Tissierella sp.]